MHGIENSTHIPSDLTRQQGIVVTVNPEIKKVTNMSLIDYS